MEIWRRYDFSNKNYRGTLTATLLTTASVMTLDAQHRLKRDSAPALIPIDQVKPLAQCQFVAKLLIIRQRPAPYR